MNTIIGEGDSKLSGGQKQRLLILLVENGIINQIGIHSELTERTRLYKKLRDIQYETVKYNI